jgi:DNA replication initiation complex subunit (GINS family)
MGAKLSLSATQIQERAAALIEDIDDGNYTNAQSVLSDLKTAIDNFETFL